MILKVDLRVTSYYEMRGYYPICALLNNAKVFFYARQNVGVGLTHHPPPPTPHIIHTGTFKTINDMFAFNL